MFAETGSDGETAGAGAYDEDVVDVFFGLDWAVCHVDFGLHC